MPENCPAGVWFLILMFFMDLFLQIIFIADEHTEAYRKQEIWLKEASKKGKKTHDKIIKLWNGIM